MIVWEKRPGQWKIAGNSKIFHSKEEALKVAGIVEEEPLETIEEPMVEEIDPLEALKLARSTNGSIEEGPHNDGNYEEQGLSESPDRGLFTATGDSADSESDSTD